MIDDKTEASLKKLPVFNKQMNTRWRIEKNGIFVLVNRYEYIDYIKKKAFEIDDIAYLEFTPSEMEFEIFEITEKDLPEIVKMGRTLYEFYRSKMAASS